MATAPTIHSNEPTSPSEYDVVIIGGGSAGYAAARTATGLGAKTAIIEGGKEVGGLCILRGCMPSKALLESAHRWHEINRAREFGLLVKAVRADMKCIQARKQFLIKDFADYRRKQLKSGKFTFLRGQASFTSPQTINVQQGKKKQQITAKSFILATGSVISIPPVPGLKETGFLTSDDVLELKKLPKKIVILGGGIIAVELGQFFSRLGVKTTLLQRSKTIVRNYDSDVSKELIRAFAAEKLEVRTGVTLKEVQATGKGKTKGKKVIFEQEGVRGRQEISAEEIFCALGRASAVSGLHLEKAGFNGEEKLTADLHQRTAVPHIYAAGDIVGPYEVVHIAIAQGEIAARNAVRSQRGEVSEAAPLEQSDYRLKTLVTFTDPEIASVGLTAAEAKEQKIDFLEAKYPFNDHGKAIIGGHEFGFVKILAEKTRGEIIGAEIIGPQASNLIHELIAVMRYRGTVQELAALPHYHPTLAEIITYPAEEIAEKLAPAKS